MTITRLSLLAAIAAMVVAGPLAAVAQQEGPPPRAATELGNFGDVPFANPQIIITRAEDRALWRKLEDKHLREMRDFEDKVDADLRALRKRQADEREATLKQFAR